MKPKIVFCAVFLIFTIRYAGCQPNDLKTSLTAVDYVQVLKDTLLSLSEQSENDFFRRHCSSILAVINSKYSLNINDSVFLTNTCKVFLNGSDAANPLQMSTFELRKRPLILSWVSPTDGTVSFSWLTLPKDWNPETRYPLYINLHGLWSVAANSIEYMTYPYLHSPSNSISFEDGYLLSPWGRGNLWYKGIAETDIWECMAALEDIAVIDPARKYLSGHSMGGYGAWSIASKSADTWAALGIMAGALWYYPVLLDENIGQALKYVPTYFICGTNDDLLEINRAAYQLLKDAGNWRLQFNTFSGGHEYVEQNVTNMYLWMRQYTKSDIPSDINEPDRASHPDLLIRCSPNPVTTTSTIVYSGPDNSIVDISIYNLSGSFVANVARGTRIRGAQSINYDISDLKPGIYFIRMKSGDMVADARMVVVR